MSTDWLVIVFIFLLFVAAFFSASETGMTAINRYRLRHKIRKNNPAAKRVAKLLKEPDRLLGVILLGSTFANVLATTVATLLAVHWFGPIGALYATIALTAIILVFCESVPKTWAVMRAQAVAFKVSWLLKWLSWIFYPLVWMLGSCARLVLWCFGMRVKSQAQAEPMSVDELHTLVGETSNAMAEKSRGMMLRMLELTNAQAADVMVPRSDIYGIDVEEPMSDITKKLLDAPHRYVPLYAEYVDHMLGAVSVRQALAMLANNTLTKESLIQIAQKNYFIPETSPLHKQLAMFQHKKYNFAVVVDEYGDVQGILTLKDILEDIIGEFEEEQDINEDGEELVALKDGSYLIDGRMNLREINRALGSELPLDGPKTISGLIIAALDGMPKKPCCLYCHNLKIELVEFNDLAIQRVKVLPE